MSKGWGRPIYLGILAVVKYFTLCLALCLDLFCVCYVRFNNQQLQLLSYNCCSNYILPTIIFEVSDTVTIKIENGKEDDSE
jgi:hypothetical protein